MDAVAVNGPRGLDVPVREPTDFYCFDELLSAEERALRQRMRNFADSEIRPIINEYWERAEFPMQLIPKMAALNFAGGTIQGYGCPGMNSIATGLVSMELARGDASICTFFGVHSGLAMGSIAELGSAAQKEKWLPPMARLEKIGAFGLTEPEIGSDASHLRCTARREGDDYVLNGAKKWIGNATFADVTIIWARGEDGEVGGYLVEKGTPGFDPQPIQGKIAKRAVINAQIELKECRVPLENKLAKAHSFKDTAIVPTNTRYGVAWEAVGHAMACYEAALAYAKERQQFGRPIASFQLVQQRLVWMLAEVTSLQLLCLRLSQLRDNGTMTGAQASLAKLVCSTRAREVAAKARETLGGNGILLEYEVARHFADMEAVYTYEGTADINLMVVGREITGLSAFV